MTKMHVLVVNVDFDVVILLFCHNLFSDLIFICLFITLAILVDVIIDYFVIDVI